VKRGGDRGTRRVPSEGAFEVSGTRAGPKRDIPFRKQIGKRKKEGVPWVLTGCGMSPLSVSRKAGARRREDLTNFRVRRERDRRGGGGGLLSDLLSSPKLSKSAISPHNTKGRESALREKRKEKRLEESLNRS